MAKRKKRLSARQRLLADKLRKREKRQKAAGILQDEDTLLTPQESAVPCGTVDGADSAPPGNFPGLGSMGFPPKEEKPLARVQASPRVKMHSPALRLSPPQGSRLFVRNEDKAPSPDSPPWVCAPPRAPGSGIGHMSDPAGQAQLDTSWEEETSRISKDEGTLTKSKMETERISKGNLNEKHDIIESINREKDMLETVESMLDFRDDTEIIENELTNEGKKDIKLANVRIFHRKMGQNIKDLKIQSDQKESTSMEDCPGEENTNLEARNLYSVSVQGSFHQADPIFGDSAGTQCVANCLSGLAYHLLKSAEMWQTADVNKVLVNGDELYTYLQNCSSITSRYLLVEELPQYFECFSNTFDFTVKTSVPSLISVSAEEPCYEDFNAHPLFEALQIALTETNGCFVCFGGNTLLIGKTNDGFFSFDSHARCPRGYLSVRGKSTRILLKDVQDVYLHLRSLAISMGISQTVACELTGVLCSLKHFATAVVNEVKGTEKYSEGNEDSRQGLLTSNQSKVKETERCFEGLKVSEKGGILSDQSEILQENDVMFMGEEFQRHDFIPLSVEKQKELCKVLGVPYHVSTHENHAASVKDMDKPRGCKEIGQDGNCFFRAVSFSLTNSENHHQHIREAVCQHLLNHEAMFQQFMRSEGSLRSYLLHCKMSNLGVWATELEILAMSHMLNVDIYTYSDMKWLQFSMKGPNPESAEQKEAIYLYHRHQNHYDVVLSVTSRLHGKECVTRNRSLKGEYNVRTRNKIRMREERRNLKLKITDLKEKRKDAFRKRYTENEKYRKKMLEQKKDMYSDADFRLKAQIRNRERYCASHLVQMASKRRSKMKYLTNLKHKEGKKRKSVEKYKFDSEHREQLKGKSKEKYKIDFEHKESVKKASIEKYKEDFEHQQNVKKASIEKYKTDLEHQQSAKRASIEKYKTDLEHQQSVKRGSIEKYKTDLEHQQSVKKASIEKYKTDLEHQQSVKKASIKKYKTDLEHQQNVKKASIEKYKTDLEHQQSIKRRSSEKYKTDLEHKITVKQRASKRYKEDESYRAKSKAAFVLKYNTNETFRSKMQKRGTRRYHTDTEYQSKAKKSTKSSYQSSAEVRKSKKEEVQQKRRLKQMNMKQEEDIVRLFKEKAKEGPNYVCTCCHRLFFQNQVQACEHQMYHKSESAKSISEICLLDKYLHECSESCPESCTKSSLWICYTCHRKIMSGKAPAEAAANSMVVEDIPSELTNLNSLEQHLIAMHIPFMKVMALPHGGQKNVHGPVICVPSDMRKTVSLPMKQDENLLLRVKLKRKLNYKGYFEYQFVNTTHIMSALSYLKEHNHWYKDIKIESSLEEDLTIQEEMTEENVEARDNVGITEEMVAFDTCLQPVDVAQEVLDHYFDDVYNIAPGEGKNPIRMLQEPGNEAKAFPCHFPSGRFSWNEERSEKLTLSRYFNNRLMNADDRFAKDTNYIFFSQYMSELNQVIEKTQISLRKSLSKWTNGKPVTANMLQDPITLSGLLRNDDAIRFMQPIRGTPAYWATAQKDLFAMLRQLGIPTWFCSFSAAEYRWNDAVTAILQQQNDNRNPEEMEWSEKNEILRCNPVTVARMFEHRFQIFHKEVILSPAEPIGKVADYFQRVEFQQRGSPHMHCLYWIENAPNIDSDGEEVVCNFIDRYVTCAVPSESDDFELRKSVLEVQQHSKKHSKSCKKKGTECRFNFPRPPSQKTFITSSQEEETTDECEKEAKLNKAYAKEILFSVWERVQNEGDRNITTEELFDDLSLTQELYEEAHNMLSAKRSIILERCPNEVWTNQYNRCLLKSWDANMDIQFVLDPFSCIVYIISYISKSEREMGMLLKQTKLEAEEGNVDARKTMKKIGSAYLHHREVSAQEAVYRVCNLRMKECSRKVVFVPVGDNPVRLSKPLSVLKKKASKDVEITDEEDDENEVWMTNIIERYMNRPDKPIFHEMCLAEFCSEFRVLAKSQVPKKENQNVFELQNGKGYVQRRTRTQPAVVRYPRFSVEKMSEKYYQSRLQLFLPYWTETQLKPPGFELYEDFYKTGYVKISSGKRKQSVKSIVESNHSKYAENEEMVDNAQDAYEMNGEPEDAWSRICPETEVLRREGIAQRNGNTVPEEESTDIIPEIESETHNADVMYHVQQHVISREEMLPVLQNLNETQSAVFYLVRKWCSAKIAGEKCEPFHLFVTGGAGTGKSHLIKAIQYEASRLLSRIMSEPDRPSVLLAAFTGTAAFNIGGNTLHHLFSLTKYLPLPYEPLGEQSLSELRVKIGDLHILIIDEISMVYKRLLYYIHERLVQIKKCKEPFGGVCVIAVGDFYQLPPVKQRKDERLYKENMSYPMDFWLDLFKVIELTEIMRQRGDLSFAGILNSFRVRERDEQLTQQQSNFLQDCIREGPEDVLHVFSTNDEVNTFNLSMLKRSCEDLLEIDAQDFRKDKTSGKLVPRNKPMTRSRSDGLPSSLLLSVHARVMLTRNCDVEDGLVNGVMGHICRFSFVENSEEIVKAIGVVFDNKEVGKKTGQYTRDGNMVFIERVQEEIKDKATTVVRHQFPIRLSWACTAHKVQGMTTDKVVVNLDKAFAPGQAYVALSRVTSKLGLFIDTEDPVRFQKNIYADPEVKAALKEMPKLIFDDIASILASNGKKIVLHNIQSLHGHFGDLKNDARFHQADIICLTETWLRSGESTENFALEGFQFHHLPRSEAYDESTALNQSVKMTKGGGVGLYLKDKKDSYDILPMSKMNIEGIAVKLARRNILLLSVYRPCAAKVAMFLQYLQKVLNYLKTNAHDCIIVGDFNEDAKIDGPIQRFMKEQNFKQLVSFSTTEGGTILDHVYVSSSIEVEVYQLPTYYSYHDAVLLKIRDEEL
ncbi:uncharacterized protein LOC134242909 [Saccostrea cucullata]|uniref:uncharacterized protein LOC134242909 n=1 Tax=Saccostrea cuccullata TaxID=36930 RepID=UPI002ED246A7